MSINAFMIKVYKQDSTHWLSDINVTYIVFIMPRNDTLGTKRAYECHDV